MAPAIATAGMAAGQAALRVFSSKYFWYGLAALILFLIIRSNWNRISSRLGLGRLFGRDRGDYSSETGSDTTMTANDKARIDQLASDIYASIHGSYGNSSKRGLFEAALALNDFELGKLDKAYKLLSPDESLYEAIDNEWMPLTQVDDDLMTALARINRK